MSLGQMLAHPVNSHTFARVFTRGLAIVCVLGLGACSQGEGDGTATPFPIAHPGSLSPTQSPLPTATPTPTVTATPTPTPEPPGEGTLALSFRINEDLQALLREEPAGPFRADVFYGEDVTNLGPREGAEVLESIYIEEVILDPKGTATGVLYVTGPLPNVEVAILGFLNSDNEAEGQEDDTSPDKWDPVTFPEDNRFKVKRDQETPAEIYFKLLNP